jgi:hypothetical protein
MNGSTSYQATGDLRGSANTKREDHKRKTCQINRTLSVSP